MSKDEEKIIHVKTEDKDIFLEEELEDKKTRAHTVLAILKWLDNKEAKKEGE